ncbi:Smr/MutS family protein [Rhodobacter sp. Har01]|uniref:Smr/MutS family protein n=1 Tax=Rhodobacter sp. Har01 TaxID=2883999 RepID=UPI001D0994A9|nr:Smr/MutS family protein [Rhodobacter sp. Har01]MCB6177913.1 Smr/MutS family protein [Rhodobacter sp. Har01]
MPRRRLLRPDEAELWQAVARTARPMHNPHLPLPETATPPLAAEEPKLPAQSRLPHFRLGERAPAARPHDLAPLATTHGLKMDAKTHARMTRGKLAPEARLDLHGMTLAEAHPELIRFILNAQGQGVRLVLVITGKGRAMFEPIPRPTGALRHQVPHWLRLPPLGQAVLQVAEAHLKHGGEGAFYVYLRRR